MPNMGSSYGGLLAPFLSQQEHMTTSSAITAVAASRLNNFRPPTNLVRKELEKRCKNNMATVSRRKMSYTKRGEERDDDAV
jgi:hypothetical protein